MSQLTLSIAEDSRTLRPTDLADFLHLFGALGAALMTAVPPIQHEAHRLPEKAEMLQLQIIVGSLTPAELDGLFDRDAFTIHEMKRESPLEITYHGCMFLLVLAVILSGGEIDLKKGIAKLPPLGSGIKAIREALGLNDKVQASFGIRGTSIKLNKEEYNALKLQDPKTKGQGGFQNFLIKLQSRVNKKTFELELSERDLETIYRYKANPNKGGWQLRFKKIFGRHFPS